MKNTASRRAAAVVAALCMSACAHNSTPVSTAAKHTTTVPQSGPSANITANVPPDVLATCQHSAGEMAAGHLAEAARLANECVASHSLPVAMRTQMLQALTFINIGLRDNQAALDSQLAAIELTPVPSDQQLVLLAHLYGINQRNDESRATLERIRISHEAKHDLDQTVGAPYYQELGSALAAEKRFQESIDAFSKAVSLEPALAEIYRRRAAAREASGDAAGARTDYVQFARWALDQEIDSPMRAKLTSLGINPASERHHPFGDANPLREMNAELLEQGRQSLKAATTPQSKAEAYGDISAFLDDTGQHAEALTAIDKAIALAPDNTSYKQSKVTTLVSLNRIDDALRLAAPIRKQAHEEAATATTPFAVYKKYGEVSGSAAVAYIQQGKWSDAIDALVDRAKGAEVYDQDYMATMYLYVRAKSAGVAPASPYFDDYIRRAAQPVVGNYRRELLLYMQGKLTIDQVYIQVVSLGNQATIQNALAEIWFMAAAYARYVKHDDDAARAFVGRLNDLQPYGTNEWMLARRGGA